MLWFRTLPPPFFLLGAAATAAPGAAQTPVRDMVVIPTPFERELTGTARPNVPGLAPYRCFESERVVVFSNDTAHAYAIIRTIRWAATQFERVFGKSVPRGVMAYSADSADLAPIVAQAQQQLGATWTSAYHVTPGDAENRGASDSVALVASRPEWETKERKALQLQRPKLAGAALQDTIARRWEGWSRFLLGFAPHAHEEAHGWFRLAYPGKQQEATWLNEAVGILAEGPPMEQRRLDQLVQFSRTDDTYVIPLERLFTRGHPVNDLAGAPDSAAAAAAFAHALAFYAQVRGVIAFLFERTQDSTVLGSIATSEATGHPMAEWLQTAGARYGLPSTVQELDKQWQEWFARLKQEKYP